MNKNTTSNSSQPQQAICSSCNGTISSNQSDEVSTSTEILLCQKCQKTQKKRRRTIVTTIVIGVLLVLGAIWWYILGDYKQRFAVGFGDIRPIQDSVKVVVNGSNKMSFNIASSTISSTPISIQNPINNIEDFHRVVAKNIEVAKNSGNNILSIPTTTILFQLGSNKISNSSFSLIKGLAKFFKETNQKATIIVEGFACNLGAKGVNDYISEQRANAVKAALITEGIDPNKIEMRWYGKSRNKEFQLSNIADYRRVLISFQ